MPGDVLIAVCTFVVELYLHTICDNSDKFTFYTKDIFVLLLNKRYKVVTLTVHTSFFYSHVFSAVTGSWCSLVETKMN